jgi:hypothetical protein
MRNTLMARLTQVPRRLLVFSQAPPFSRFKQNASDTLNRPGVHDVRAPRGQGQRNLTIKGTGSLSP